MTDKSITDSLRFIGGMLITWYSKWQSSIIISTFGAEFISLKQTIEEAVAYRYYCRSFGMIFSKPIVIYEDNMSVILNSTQLESILNHKCIALSYHFYCKQVAEVTHILTKLNLVDALKKGLDSTNFNDYFLPFMVNKGSTLNNVGI